MGWASRKKKRHRWEGKKNGPCREHAGIAERLGGARGTSSVPEVLFCSLRDARDGGRRQWLGCAVAAGLSMGYIGVGVGARLPVGCDDVRCRRGARARWSRRRVNAITISRRTHTPRMGGASRRRRAPCHACIDEFVVKEVASISYYWCCVPSSQAY